MLKSLLLLLLSLATLSSAQFSQQGSKLVGTGSLGTTPEQGTSVALSADGNTAIVGGWDDNGATGAAWVFTRSGGVWSQQGSKLVGTGGVGNSYQGTSIALSADGNTAIVGGYFDNTRVGAAWIFTRSDGIWSQQGTKLVGTGVVNIGGHQSYQGYSVGISADGNTAIVGGEWDNNTVGASWIYQRSDGVWSQVGSKLVGSGLSGGSQQGCAVAISGDGMTVVIGGNNDAPNYGSAWIFVLHGTTWVQQGNKLGQGYNSAFGGAVAISNDGNTVLVGGSSDYDFGLNGAVWVYVRSLVDSTWKLQGTKLTASDNTGTAQFGVAVSLSSDGNTAVIGGYSDNSYAGGAWIFKRSTVDSAWIQYGTKLVGPDTSGKSRQGFGVAISGDGTTALVGGYADSAFNGATWVFVGPGTPLPLELTSFTGRAAGMKTMLTWETASEVNTAKFEVERATMPLSSVSNAGINGTAKAFVRVGSMAGAGNSNLSRTYSFEELLTGSGTYSYRLKQIDRDGAFKYSKEVLVHAAVSPGTFSLSQNYPNPFNPSTSILFTLPVKGRAVLKIFNTLGEEVATLFNGEVEAGSVHRVEFDGSKLADGIYFSRLESGGRIEVKKMALIK